MCVARCEQSDGRTDMYTEYSISYFYEQSVNAAKFLALTLPFFDGKKRKPLAREGLPKENHFPKDFVFSYDAITASITVPRKPDCSSA